jgi:hypothetical protein
MSQRSNRLTRRLRVVQAVALFCLLAACQKSTPPATRAVSNITATVSPDGSVLIKTPSAEFDLSTRGYLQGFLVNNGRRSTLDEPAPNAGAMRPPSPARF